MKLDQETVAKHQFWFLLGGYFFLWLTAVLWMKFTYPAEIKVLREKYDTAAKGVEDARRNPVNTATFLPPWEKATKEFSDHKGVIWGEAWKWQAGMYDWPLEWVKKYGGMTSPQVQLSADDRSEYRDKLYPNQIDSLRATAPKWLSPVELKDGFDNVFKPMPKRDWKEIPTREEIWLAQEDIWVKRELLIDVYKAMAWQAVMYPKDIDEKKEPMPKGVEARYRFHNKNWEITLHIRKNDKGDFVIGGDSTIKNVHPSRHPQPLTSAKGRGIWFNVAQDTVRTTFEVRGEPVSWNETKKFSAENYPDPLSGIKWDKEWLKQHPIFVSQGFDRTNCPIRRINAIELDKQDCRTFIWPLQPNHMLAELDALPEDQDASKKADTAGAPAAGMAGGMAGGSGAPPGGSGMMNMQNMQSMMGGAPGGGTASSGNRTPNNEIDRDRYLQSKDQDKKLNPPSRHLPLAIQLIVEQSHMHNILLALANSRLRFQITQVEFNHVKDYTPQSEDDKDKKEGTDTEGPHVFTGGMPAMAGMAGGSQMQMQMQQMQKMMMGMGSGGSMRGGSAMPPGMGSGGMGGPPGMPPGGMGSGGMPPGMGSGGMPPGGMGSGGMPPAMAGMMRPAAAGGMDPRSMKSNISYAPGGKRRGAGPFMTAGGADRNQAASNQHDDNLVELTVYGIATLYRAPDAPQTTEQAGQPGAPATQPGQQPTAPAATPSGASSPPAATTQQGGSTPPPAAAKQPNTAPPPPAAGKQPSGSAAPPAPKQPEKKVDQQKAPPPPPPPGGNKR